MRTKRQPTIKTLLLFMVTNAILFAAIAVPGREAISEKPHLAYIYLGMSVPQMLCWSILPMGIDMFVRSLRRAVGACFAYGCACILFHFVVAKFVDINHIQSFVLQICLVVFAVVMRSPTLSLIAVIQSLTVRYDEELPAAVIGAAWGLWLIFYTLSCLLVMKSCRLREVPSVSPVSDKSSVAGQSE